VVAALAPVAERLARRPRTPTDAAPACAVAIGRALADEAVVAVVARTPDAEAHNALVADAEERTQKRTSLWRRRRSRRWRNSPARRPRTRPDAARPPRTRPDAAAACSFHSVAARAHGRSIGAGVRRVPGRAGAGWAPARKHTRWWWWRRFNIPWCHTQEYSH